MVKPLGSIGRGGRAAVRGAVRGAETGATGAAWAETGAADKLRAKAVAEAGKSEAEAREALAGMAALFLLTRSKRVAACFWHKLRSRRKLLNHRHLTFLRTINTRSYKQARDLGGLLGSYAATGGAGGERGAVVALQTGHGLEKLRGW